MVASHKLYVYSLHLDANSEDIRIHQLTELLAWVQEPHVLVGDFNAVHRRHYNDEDWDKIQATRRKYHLERSRSDAMTMLLDTAGYVDPLEDRREVGDVMPPLLPPPLSLLLRQLST